MTKRTELLAILTAHFPAAFPPEPKAIRPLKVGIHQDIQAALPEVDPKALRQALARHTRRLAYLRAVERGGERIDLDGTSVEPVTPEQQAHAAEKLKEAKAHLKAKQAAQTPVEPSNAENRGRGKDKPLEAEKHPQAKPEGPADKVRPTLSLKKRSA